MSSWIERMGEPLAPTGDEAARYIRTELERAMPVGWMLRWDAGEPLAWSIVKKDLEPGEWPNKDYAVRLSKSLELLIFTHGNNDVGPLSLHHVLPQSLVVDAAALRHFGMAACLEHLMTR